ncbi:uncharacterized protein rbbp8l isoform X2 [Polyodon spathula]|uniref:uncharacterized protein rbbp8l isoform X2 n=1 Tax=Polyodon spathula TaxID=7913 RepID=UPI001B7EAB3D|nr:uncharacterized protein rbbp8l isoform X2 [Polyodon spathula]
MPMGSFQELHNQLRELHEKEIHSLQAKVIELTMEKCCDSQRIEDLFKKNQQLREHQKMLHENVKLLENRLRAGLCDRCTVTQDVAKKKQQDYETSQLHSLQHITILVNEINVLKKENKKLLEEVNNLSSMLDEMNGRHPKAPVPGCSSQTDAALVLVATAHKTKETLEERVVRQQFPNSLEIRCHQQLSEGGMSGYRKPTSWSGHETQVDSVHQKTDQETKSKNTQLVSNQLHHTIAMMASCMRTESARASPGEENGNESKAGVKGSEAPERHEVVSPPAVRIRIPKEEKPHILNSQLAYRAHSEQALRLKLDWSRRHEEKLVDHKPAVDCYESVYYMKGRTEEWTVPQHLHNNVDPKKGIFNNASPEYWHENKFYQPAPSGLSKINKGENNRTDGILTLEDRSKPLNLNGSDQKTETAEAPLDLSDYGRSKDQGLPSMKAEAGAESPRSTLESGELQGAESNNSSHLRAVKRSHSDTSSSVDPDQSPVSSHLVASHHFHHADDGDNEDSSDQNEEKDIGISKQSRKENEEMNQGLGKALYPVVALTVLKTETEPPESSDSKRGAADESEEPNCSEGNENGKERKKRKRGEGQDNLWTEETHSLRQ